MVGITETAAVNIQKLLAKKAMAGGGLRVGIKKVGCSGFGYVFDYADEVGTDDVMFEDHDARLVVVGFGPRFREGIVAVAGKDRRRAVRQFGKCGDPAPIVVGRVGNEDIDVAGLADQAVEVQSVPTYERVIHAVLLKESQ